MSRVTVVVNDLQPYGSQRVAATLAGSLVQLGATVDLLTLEAPGRGELTVPPGVRRHMAFRSGHGARSYASLVWAVRRHLSDRKADVVMSHMMFSNLVTLAATSSLPHGRRSPVLITEHNRPSANLEIERSPDALRRLARTLYPRANAIIGVSQAVVADTAATFGLDPAAIRCILNPVDVEAIRREARQNLDHPWLHTEGHLAPVVCVGAFRRAKGQDVLVHALGHLPDARAILIGDGPLLHDVQEVAARIGVSDRVDFLGYRSDASAFMARSSVVAVPSRWEGFGLVAVEAAAVGRPVVGSQVSGLSELVPRYVPGELVAPDNPTALAAALQRGLTGEGPGGSADFTPFSPVEVAERYLQAAGAGA